MADDEIETATSNAVPCPFFHRTTRAEAESLAILHLKRDNLVSLILQSTANDGYAEGAVTNTRFGSYPHSTLIGAPWGSQIRASKVDTGTRGRKAKIGQDSGDVVADAELDPNKNKRKLNDSTEDPMNSTKRRKQEVGKSHSPTTFKTPPVEAGMGFMHLLPPTPESWTSSLDHRTQVVYVPDYSYILTRLRVKPGDVMIEAGAGSGSFTHAAARAVFNASTTSTSARGAVGRVYSFEYHEPRVKTLSRELHEHGLDAVVRLIHRDVCTHGFSLPTPSSNDVAKVNAIFLDLPAPWLALRHLTRSTSASLLDPNSEVHICTFSPCIEQVAQTVTALRKAGWADVQMVEVQNRRIDVRRERVGLREEGLRGVNAVAATVEESLTRLREVDSKLKDFHKFRTGLGESGRDNTIMSKAERLEQIKREAEGRKVFKDGNLVHRTEPDIKTHTSYLVFAVLPREWTDEDEARCSHGREPITT